MRNKFLLKMISKEQVVDDAYKVTEDSTKEDIQSEDWDD